MMKAMRGLLAAMAPLVLLGCTSASMRVEVEVYKGPLSKEPLIQAGELEGLLGAIGNNYRNFSDTAGKLYTANHCKDADPSTSKSLACNVLASIKSGCQMSGRLEKIERCLTSTKCSSSDCSDQKQALLPVLRDLSSVASELKSKALNDVYYQNSWRPQDENVRVLATNYINLSSEASNQLGSRADALLKQLNGADAERLPQSVFLRDSAPTSLLQAYVWDWAMKPPLSEDFTNFGEDRSNRVRALERHFSDNYWSTINTVVASGEGKVGMALIKDDIGNWNLKNFENDPTDLLQAYKEVGLATLKTAADMAKRSTTGPLDGAAKLMTVANQFNFGTDAGQGDAGLTRMLGNVRVATATNLNAVVEEMKSRQTALEKAKSDALLAAGNVVEVPIAGCAAPVIAPAKTAAGQASKVAKDVLAALSTPVPPGNATLAKQSADSSVSEAGLVDSDPPAKACEHGQKAVAEAAKAGHYLAAYRAEVELAGLPANAKKKLNDVLDGYEKILAALAQANLDQNAGAAAGTSK